MTLQLLSDMFVALLALSILFMYVIAFSFLIWMLVDSAKHDKFWWLVIILGLPFIGALMYYFTEKRKLYEKIEKHL